jgi:hypothetical protein
MEDPHSLAQMLDQRRESVGPTAFKTGMPGGPQPISTAILN